jgi:hypothetical protein
LIKNIVKLDIANFVVTIHKKSLKKNLMKKPSKNVTLNVMTSLDLLTKKLSNILTFSKLVLERKSPKIYKIEEEEDVDLLR